MVGGHEDQRLLEADQAVDGKEQLRQRRVQAQEIVLCLQAEWTERVADVIGSREADGQKVRGPAPPGALRFHQGLDEIQDQAVAHKALHRTQAFSPLIQVFDIFQQVFRKDTDLI